MQLRNEYPVGVPCWVDIASPDPQDAARFYGGLFRWEIEERGGYRIGRRYDGDVAGIGSLVPGDPAPVWNTYVRVQSAADAAAKVVAAGGTAGEPHDTPGIGRVAVCADQQGAQFRVLEPAALTGSQRVNAPGTWNFSELNTNDFDGAIAFYGPVFGWEADPLDFGGVTFMMWRRPGYGDFLESIDPGVRKRHTDGGAPPGFTDAVAWLQEPTGGAPPHWSVTFSVDDTEAVAARAVELGGSVEVPPFNAGVAIVAHLRDPQGGRFTASQYLG
jgi:predicted enzyme related to lactoylglutathione lyase